MPGKGGGGEGAVGSVSLKEPAFREWPNHRATCMFPSGPERRGWGSRRVCRNGTEGRNHLSVSSSWKQKGSCLERSRSPSLSQISRSRQISEETACRIRPHNQPDIETQRCNYYPLKPNMCETKKKKKIFPIRAHKNPSTAFVLN